MAGTRFSVVLLLTPHSPDAAQHAGSFVESNILLGAASARQTLYDRSRRCRAAWADPADEHGESTLGCAAYPWRICQAPGWICGIECRPGHWQGAAGFQSRV